MTLEQLKEKYPNFLMGLDDVEHFIGWYQGYERYATDWDATRYAFALDALEYLKTKEGWKPKEFKPVAKRY